MTTLNFSKRISMLGRIKALEGKKSTASRCQHERKNKRNQTVPSSQKQVRFDTCETASSKNNMECNHDNCKYPTTEETTATKERWYSMKELNALFLKDLEDQHRNLLDSTNSNLSVDANPLSSISSGATTDYTNRFRGLEFHLPHNHHKVEQSARYVRAVVQQSYQLYQTGKKKGRLYNKSWPRLVVQGDQSTTKRRLVAELELAEFASQYTHQTREHALGVAAQDETAAMAIHNVAAASETSGCQFGRKTENSTKFIRTRSNMVSHAAPGKAEFAGPASSASVALLHNKLKAPLRSSITAKSA